MGAAAAIRERHRAGGPAFEQIRPPPSFLGSCARVATFRRSISAPIIRWRSKCGPHTIPCGNTVSLGVVVDTTNLEGSIWTWWREGGKFHIEKTATIPAEPAQKDKLPPLLQGFGAVPPLVTDIDLSMDDRFLYVACWGTGEMRQYDVTDPRKPRLAGSVHIGGIARRTPHPNGKPYAGGPQMVEISRDGKRVYWTNSLYSTWDDQFYPDGVPGAQVMANANSSGGLELAKDYLGELP